ncbi:chorismate synthase [bacterium]|nr:chorismate synthase [bacterium]
MTGNTYGRVFRITACGESYGGGLAVICDGVPAGMMLSREEIQAELDRRRPGTSPIDSPRLETDQCEVFSGVFEGKTTGAPVGIFIRNVDTEVEHIEQYRRVKDIVRPGHAEYTYRFKYDEHADWCGAGRASGRETAVRVAAGALAKKILARDGIEVVGYVKELHGITSRSLSFAEIRDNREKTEIRCPDLEAAEQMIQRALDVKAEGDTVGGVIEIIARNVPPGLGEPVFDKLEANIGKGLLSIPAVKGVEFGTGFELARLKGSEANDIPYLDGDVIRFRTNHSGGIDGGISNGEDIVVRMVVKPTSTVSIDQDSVNMATLQPAPFAATTRRDAQICGRAVPVGEAMVAITLLDHLMLWEGYDAVSKVEHKLPWRPRA